MSMPLHMNGAEPPEQPAIDLVDMAERCRIAGHAPEMLPADARLFGECADVFDAMRTVLGSVAEVVRQHRAHQFQVDVESIAGAIEAVAIEYERGRRPFSTPQGALREVAATLKAGPKAEKKKPLIVMGEHQ